MTTNQLVNLANIQADKRADCISEDLEFNSIEYHNAIDKMHTIPSFAEYENIICESTKCFKGKTAYYANRFYIKKADGNRGTFSRAKSVLVIG